MFLRNPPRSRDCGDGSPPPTDPVCNSASCIPRWTKPDDDYGARVTLVSSWRKIRNRRRAGGRVGGRVLHGGWQITRDYVTPLLFLPSSSWYPPFLATFYPGHVAATENITERIPFRGRRCLRVAVLSAKNHGEWIFASGFWLPTFSLHNYQATENITLFRDVFFFLFFFHREKLLKEKLTP